MAEEDDTATSHIKVAEVPEQSRIRVPHFYTSKPHHLKNGNGYQNPWLSYNPDGFSRWEMFKMGVINRPKAVPIPLKEDERDVRVLPANLSDPSRKHPDALKATWIGHASWVLEFPSLSPSERGLTLLVDPVWSERMSPTNIAGPKRFLPTPLKLNELPWIDAVLISHDHYDHCDLPTLQQFWQIQRKSQRPTYFFVPMGLKSWMIQNVKVPSENVVELDWWEQRRLEHPGHPGQKLDITCTPSQHECARTPFDKNCRLWCSWTLEYSDSSGSSVSCFFAGDTGYRTCRVCESQESPYPGRSILADLPSCPVFKEIGDLTDGVDLALLPIGCFMPVPLLSRVHAAPWDAVDMHKDLRARTSVAMHHGTLRGGISGAYEPIDWPVKELKAACTRESVTYNRIVDDTPIKADNAFLVCDVGRTLIVPSRS